MKDEVDVDIIKSNMRTVGMSREEYFELLPSSCAGCLCPDRLFE
jgi:hypothetical protein